MKNKKEEAMPKHETRGRDAALCALIAAVTFARTLYSACMAVTLITMA